jgi:hypothetical protein
MLIPLLAALVLSGPDTLRVYNSHGHEMAVFATIGTKTVELGTIQAGDTASFAVTIPDGVTKLELRAYPPGAALQQITYVLEVKPGKKLFWSFEDS